MCMADVHICQCISIDYAWLKAYVVRILRFFDRPVIYEQILYNIMKRSRVGDAFVNLWEWRTDNSRYGNDLSPKT
jgi:hypothetical protein